MRLEPAAGYANAKLLLSRPTSRRRPSTRRGEAPSAAAVAGALNLAGPSAPTGPGRTSGPRWEAPDVPGSTPPSSPGLLPTNTLKMKRKRRNTAESLPALETAVGAPPLCSRPQPSRPKRRPGSVVNRLTGIRSVRH